MSKSSKDEIMARLKSSGVAPEPRPEFGFTPMSYPDKEARLRQALAEAAVNVVEQKPDDDINELILKAYPGAKRIASDLEEISCATENPDDLDDPRDLNGVDVAVVRGEFAVLENGMVWVPRKMRHKALMFIAENLVILLDKTQTADTMHEAYRHPLFTDYDYGCFIAGPSKTADIEQALVIGAHGARAVTVILR